MRCFTCLVVGFVLAALSACATHEPVWIIPGDLGTTHQWTGKLSAVGSGNIARVLVQVTGLGPPSPSSSSRMVYLTPTCDGLAAAQMRWHDESIEYDVVDSRSNEFVCGETTTMYFSYDHNYRQVVFELPAGINGDVGYTLTAEVHAPY